MSMLRHSTARRYALAAVVAIAAALGGTSATASAAPPNSIASIGDSITRGFHTGGLLQDVPANSWSTGTNATVNSHYNRLLTINPAISGKNYNRAVTGAKMNGFAGQAQNVVADGAEYVTVLLGANDACTSTEAAMTPIATYRAQFQAGMDVLDNGLPNARIFIASVPDIYRLWDVGRTSATARFIWGLYGTCQSMLANPTSTTAADVARRARVRQRVIDFNTQLKEVCAQYLRCRYDNDAAFNTQFLLSDLSTLDYFHPNVAGQTKAANTTWGATFNFADQVPPTTAISADRDADGADGWYRDDVEITLSSDDPDLRGTEFDYKLRDSGGATDWRTYTGPFTLGDEGTTDVVYRSLDVNGNVEEQKSAEFKIDKTAPSLSVACPAPTLLNGAASATVTGSDALSGFAPGEDPNGTYPLDTSIPGRFDNDVEVADLAGNVTSATCSYLVSYGYGGILQPVNADGSSVFKGGSTVPLKFRLSDAAGTSINDATATLQIAKTENGVDGVYEGAVSTAAATSGNLFRSAGDGQYIFNLSTKGLATGTYRAKITLGDTTEQTVRFGLK